MNSVKLGDRVYYKDKGPTDTGVIVDIILDDYPFVVKWDNSPIESDEKVDQFMGSQLILIEGD